MRSSESSEQKESIEFAWPLSSLTQEELSSALRYVAPIRLIRDEQAEDAPTQDMGLCLSGGGYRAMLFHAGALWRLNELRYLPKLDRISSVSGGSILAGVLGQRWDELDFKAGFAQAYEKVIVDRLMALADNTLDWQVVFAGALPGGGVNKYLTKMYEKALFHGALLQDLPDKPMFVFNAASLQSGKLWRFMKTYMADYKVGRVASGDTTIAAAVGASSAFPPFLSPSRLRLNEADYLPPTPGIPEPLHKQPYTTRPRLVDGGAYDNFGLETVWKRCRVVLVSDGGRKLRPEPKPWAFWLKQTHRVMTILFDQIGGLRKRHLIASYKFKLRRGAYWSIGSHARDYPVTPVYEPSDCQVKKLAGVTTRLTKIDRLTQRRLVNWGYAITDTAMRAHMRGQEPPPSLPYAEAGFGDECEGECDEE